MEIRLAGAQDIDAWMALVEQVRDIFPGLETAGAMAEHRATVLHFVQIGVRRLCGRRGAYLGGAAILKRKQYAMLSGGRPGLPQAAHWAEVGAIYADADGGMGKRHGDHLSGWGPQRESCPCLL